MSDQGAPCNVCLGTGGALPKGEGESWFRWRCEHWGCEWDANFSGPAVAWCPGGGGDPQKCAEAMGATHGPGAAVYTFDRPWAPPLPVVRTASRLFPELQFTLQFAEVGEGYAGRVRFVGGLAVEVEEFQPEDVLMPEEMVVLRVAGVNRRSPLPESGQLSWG